MDGPTVIDPADGAAARGKQARANLVAALRECCELADAVESLEGPELLQGVVRGQGGSRIEF